MSLVDTSHHLGGRDPPKRMGIIVIISLRKNLNPKAQVENACQFQLSGTRGSKTSQFPRSLVG